MNEERIKEIISGYKSAIIAFSGGVDSTYLAAVAKDVLKERLLLVTATSSTYPFYELTEAKNLAKELNIKHRVIVSEEVDIPGFSDNPPDRCYYCKGELFSLIKKIADEDGYDAVFEGSNYDDLSDHRPGMKAVKELGIISPLLEAKLTKKTIRKFSADRGLPTANKPSFACLASRFPYGEKITDVKLDRVGKCELHLRELGFKQFRVRSHGDLARIEFDMDEIENGWRMRNGISEKFKSEGFTFVAIDTDGYRTGAMNEVL